jgi:hypothetical protein
LDTHQQEAQQHTKHQLFYTIIIKKGKFFTIIVTENKRIGFLKGWMSTSIGFLGHLPLGR